MNIRRSLKHIIENPLILLLHVCRHVPFRWISDELFLKLSFYTYQHEKLDLKKTVTFNAKLQWLKLHNRNRSYTDLADKYRVREFVKNKIGKEHLIPLLGVWDSVEDIDFSKLPNSFVLKCNHDSGSVIICRDKSTLDIRATKRRLRKALKLNQFWRGREWAYFHIKRKIIAEELISDSGNDLKDYKFFCFNGEPMFLQVDIDRFKNHKRNFYNLNWEFLDVKCKIPNDKSCIEERPRQFGKMIDIAKKLSEGIPHVRVDLYLSKGNIYFGEMTFYHAGGYEIITSHEYDILWGVYKIA